MGASLIYRSTPLYELAMLLLYGRHYTSRYHAIADLIPEGASVLDVACGPAVLYGRYLRKKGVDYMGLDLNEGFIDGLERMGGRGRVWDLRRDEPLPRADYVIMQASLYHFLPDARPVVGKMIEAAREKVIIAEPVRNLATSDSRLLALLGRLLTNPGSGTQPLRFNAETLDQFFSAYDGMVESNFLIAGGREKVYVLKKDSVGA